jgi:hypothetical protein
VAARLGAVADDVLIAYNALAELAVAVADRGGAHVDGARCVAGLAMSEGAPL